MYNSCLLNFLFCTKRCEFPRTKKREEEAPPHCQHKRLLPRTGSPTQATTGLSVLVWMLQKSVSGKACSSGLCAPGKSKRETQAPRGPSYRKKFWHVPCNSHLTRKLWGYVSLCIRKPNRLMTRFVKRSPQPCTDMVVKAQTSFAQLVSALLSL